MAITEDVRPKPKDEKESERELLARSFKEARSILDDLERVQDLAIEESLGEQSVAHAEQDAPMREED